MGQRYPVGGCVTVRQQKDISSLSFVIWRVETENRLENVISFMNGALQKMTLEDFSTPGCLSHINRMCKYSVRYIYFVLTTGLTFTLILQLPPSNYFLFLSPKFLSGLDRAGWVTPPAFVRFTLLPWHCRSRINTTDTNTCVHTVFHTHLLSVVILSAVHCCLLLM